LTWDRKHFSPCHCFFIFAPFKKGRKKSRNHGVQSGNAGGSVVPKRDALLKQLESRFFSFKHDEWKVEKECSDIPCPHEWSTF
jgi:hypothetical protein